MSNATWGFIPSHAGRSGQGLLFAGPTSEQAQSKGKKMPLSAPAQQSPFHTTALGSRCARLQRAHPRFQARQGAASVSALGKSNKPMALWGLINMTKGNVSHFVGNITFLCSPMVIPRKGAFGQAPLQRCEKRSSGKPFTQTWFGILLVLTVLLLLMFLTFLL